jgi:hypothetical protein
LVVMDQLSLFSFGHRQLSATAPARETAKE